MFGVNMTFILSSEVKKCIFHECGRHFVNIFQYIRMTDEDSVDNLLELMEKQWKIMEPERPNLVISVVGGAKNFKLDGRMRDTFSSGLIKVIEH